MEKIHNKSLSLNKKEKPEVADILRLYGDAYKKTHSVSYK